MDVVVYLLQDNQIDRAVDWLLEATLLSVVHNLDINVVMSMDADSVAALYETLYDEKEVFVKPYIPAIDGDLRGWDNVVYGDAAWRKKDG